MYSKNGSFGNRSNPYHRQEFGLSTIQGKRHGSELTRSPIGFFILFFCCVFYNCRQSAVYTSQSLHESLTFIVQWKKWRRWLEESARVGAPARSSAPISLSLIRKSLILTTLLWSFVEASLLGSSLEVSLLLMVVVHFQLIHVYSALYLQLILNGVKMFDFDWTSPDISVSDGSCMYQKFSLRLSRVYYNFDL